MTHRTGPIALVALLTLAMVCAGGYLPMGRG